MTKDTVDVKEEPRPRNVWESIERMTELLAKEGIAKDKGGVGDIKYKFRGIDDIRNTIAPLQKQCAMVIVPHVKKRVENERTTKNGAFALWVVLDVDFEIVNTIDGSKTVVPVVGEAVDYSDKGTQKCMSQVYKIFAINTFNIPTEGEQDQDGEKIDIQAKREGVFETDEMRRLWVANCKDAFEKQESALALKDCESFYHEKLILMGASKDSDDGKAAAEVRSVYSAKLASFAPAPAKKGGL
jgi:ERF superfamily